MNIPRRLTMVLFLLVVILPQTASANSGTPMLLSTVFHLFIGNALIGMFEAYLLIRFFKVSNVLVVLGMIVANYVSAWSAVGLLSNNWFDRSQIDLGNLRIWFWGLVAATWVLTVVIEWPFIAWLLRGRPGVVWRSFRASLAVQTCSYFLMFSWYWLVSGTSLLTGVNVVNASELSLPGKVVVYYIDPTDGDVYRRPISGGSADKVFDLNSEHRSDRLRAVPVDGAPGHWNVQAVSVTQNDDSVVSVLSDQVMQAAEDLSSSRPRNTWMNAGDAPRLGSATDSSWSFRSGFWAAGGLAAKNKITLEKVRFSMETPLIMWYCRNAIHLPGDVVLFQLGDDQICVFDPATRRIACLWKGRGATAVIPGGN